MIFSIYTPFAEQLVAHNDGNLLDYGPEEQTARVVAALERIGNVTTLAPFRGGEVDLAGFGTASVVFVTRAESYVLLSDVAEQLGWFQPRAHEWAEQQHQFAVQDQRRDDEERGDGRLGWDRLLDFIDLDLRLTVDDPSAKPDASGGRWSYSGDWLISLDRLPLLLSCSPWGKEFMDNTMDAFMHGMHKVHGDKLKDIPTLRPDGTPTGSTAFDAFRSDLTEEEALRKARRGPALGDDLGGGEA